MAAGGKRPGAGRPKGTPNKVNAEARVLFKSMFQELAPTVKGWIEAAGKKDPARGAELTLKLAEFHLPKLQRLNIDLTKIPIEEIAAEVQRRLAESER